MFQKAKQTFSSVQLDDVRLFSANGYTLVETHQYGHQQKKRAIIVILEVSQIQGVLQQYGFQSVVNSPKMDEGHESSMYQKVYGK